MHNRYLRLVCLSLLLGIFGFAGAGQSSEENVVGVPVIDDLNEESMRDLWESTGGVRPDGEDLTSLAGAEEILNPPNEYHYAAFGKPDPFVKPFAPPVRTRDTNHDRDGGDAIGKNKEGYEIPLVSALQVSLHLLQIKGIWEIGGGERKALIAVVGEKGNTAMQGLIAKVGDPIGLAGKIIKIEKNSVVTRQYRLREDGSREFEDVVLTLGTSIPNRSAPEAMRKGRVILSPGKEPQLQYDNLPLMPASAAVPAPGELQNQQAPLNTKTPQTNMPLSGAVQPVTSESTPIDSVKR